MKTKFKNISGLVEYLEDHPEVTEGEVSVGSLSKGGRVVDIKQFRKDMGGEVDPE